MTHGYSPKLQDEFEAYLKFLFPEGLDRNSEQWDAMREAFFAGAIIAYESPYDYRNEIMIMAESKCRCLRENLQPGMCPYQDDCGRPN